MISTHNYKPIRFFVITFVVTFVLWFAGAYTSVHEELSGLYMLFMLPGLLTPFFVSIGMIAFSGDRDLRRDFWNRLTNLRLIRGKTIPFLLLSMPLVVLASTGLSLLAGESPNQFQPADGFSFTTGFVPVLLLLLMAATFEELGWRGYAFDSLQSRYSYFTASIVFSVLWSLWHLPLLFVHGSYQWEIFQMNPWYAVNFFVSIVPMGVIISWVCAKNGKSVLAAILYHFLINMSQEFLAITQITKSIETGVLVLVAAAIVAIDRDLFFSRTPRVEAVPA
jgi:hypothetical protein